MLTHSLHTYFINHWYVKWKCAREQKKEEKLVGYTIKEYFHNNIIWTHICVGSNICYYDVLQNKRKTDVAIVKRNDWGYWNPCRSEQWWLICFLDGCKDEPKAWAIIVLVLQISNVLLITQSRLSVTYRIG